MTIKYNPIHQHSSGSLLDGLSSPADLARRAVQIGATATAISDHGVLTSVPAFFKAVKNACGTCGYQRETHSAGSGRCLVKGTNCLKYEPCSVKAIAGIEMYLCKGLPTDKSPENRSLAHLVVLAKNRDGWDGLIQATSLANHPDHHHYKPRLDLETLAGFAKGNWITFSGHPGSQMADVCFANPKEAYRSRTVEEARSKLKPPDELKKDLTALARKYQRLFGEENFFLEIQLIDKDNLPAAVAIAETLRELSRGLGIPRVATPDAHYPERKDAQDQRVLLCSSLNTSLRRVEAKLRNDEDVQLGGFFRSDSYHVPSPEEMVAVGHDEEELKNSIAITDRCESYSIDRQPMLPKFPCPDGMTEGEYVRHLCREGWKKKIQGKVPKKDQPAYADRIKEELSVFDQVGLHGYFLVVWDMIQYATQKLGCLAPMGRGSAAGTLVGYLMGVHSCDPIAGGLSFARFFNVGRTRPGKITLPDIDTDVPVEARDAVIAYLKDRWGHDNVLQIATFQTLQGREALTQVLRAHDFGDYAERKAIAKKLPQEQAITDKLQEMKEEEGHASIIRYALETCPQDYSEYCALDDEGNFTGPLGELFAQASRLEGCKRARGKHASGIAITPEPLGRFAPLVYDTKTKDCLVGFEYEDAEMVGIPKLDILGVAVYGKVQDCLNFMRNPA